MSQFLDNFHALLDKVVVGTNTDPATKQAIADLSQHLTENDATDAEQSQAITELVTKFGAVATPDNTPPSVVTVPTADSSAS